RMIAAIPVVCMAPRTEWSGLAFGHYDRPEFPAGQYFAKINGTRTVQMFTIARLACIPFSLWGGWACYRWSRELFGYSSGCTALALWCFCPNILAWGATITPDVAAAACAVAAGWQFWRWLKAPDGKRTATATLTLGVALLVKSTCLLLLII